MARKRQGRDQERTQRYKEGRLVKALRTPVRRRHKREELVGVTGRRKQDQRRLKISGSDDKALILDTQKRMKEYKANKPTEYKCGGKVKGYKKGGMVCRGGGAATRGLGFTRNG
jgi:hypothetical protein